MTAAHTPGPWTVGQAANAARDHAICAGELVIARATGFGCPAGEGWSPESAVNARLIAAAPELLAALEEIAKGEGPFSRDPLTHASNTIDSMKEIARAAIAKAKGQPS